MSRLLVVLVSTLCLAQQDPKPKLASIKGTVANSVTGEPLSRATLTVHSQSGEEPSHGGVVVEAKASGEFEITDLKPGTYAITASRRGFVDPMQGSIRPKTLKVDAGEVVKGVKVTLAPQAVITAHH